MSASSDLLIDVGHSRAKWGRCRDGQLLTSSVGASTLDDRFSLRAIIERESIRRVLWSPQSHRASIERLRNDFRSLGVSCRTVVTGSLNLPVAAAYPDLGSDRWLALQWPWVQSERALCVIDCGTAITVDAVDGRGQHQGGWIMAGLTSLRRGLAQGAPDLPPDNPAPGTDDLPAMDSAKALGGGFRLQLIGGLVRALKQLERILGPDFDCWLTGGDADLLRPAIDRQVLHDPHLVLRGLALASERS